MKTKNRLNTLSFFIALLITFGITSLDFDQPALNNNIRAYVSIAGGLVLLIVYFVIRKRAQT